MCREGEIFFPALRRSSVLPVISGICRPTLAFYALLPAQVVCLNSPNPPPPDGWENMRERGGEWRGGEGPGGGERGSGRGGSLVGGSGGGATGPQFGQICKPQMCRQQAAEQGVDEAARAHFLCSLAASQF